MKVQVKSICVGTTHFLKNGAYISYVEEGKLKILSLRSAASKELVADWPPIMPLEPWTAEQQAFWDQQTQEAMCAEFSSDRATFTGRGPSKHPFVQCSSHVSQAQPKKKESAQTRNQKEASVRSRGN